MKARKTKADRIREYLQKYPAADVAKVAEKFETAKPVVYKLRKEVQAANVAAAQREEDAKEIKRKRVTLTAGQFLVAKKLGIDPFEYAKEVAKHAPEPSIDLSATEGEEDESATWTATANDSGDIVATLTERGKRYGKFTGHAKVTQELKRVLWNALADKPQLADDQQEALDMICHKLGRIVNGDPNYADSWVDIAGYAKLVSDRLEGVER